MVVLLSTGLVVLLLSNIWILREHERMRLRVEQYRAETRALEERFYRILLEIDTRYNSDLQADAIQGGADEAGHQ